MTTSPKELKTYTILASQTFVDDQAPWIELNRLFAERIQAHLMSEVAMSNMECHQILPGGERCQYRTDSQERMDQHQHQHADGSRGATWDNCSVCGSPINLTSAYVLRVHGPRNNRCPGSGKSGFFGR